MPLTVFDNAYFLSSLGWAVGNSLWQAGLLWLLYKFITINNKQSALFRYNLSILFLFLSFVWFVTTAIQNYFLLKDSSFTAVSIFGNGKLFLTKNISTVLPLMSVLYLLLLSLYVFKFTRQYRAIRLIKTSGLHKASVDIRLFISNTAAHLGIKKNVAVWISDKVDVPSVAGFIKPVILLPAAVINNLTTSQVETVLLHELAHIKRNDFFINLVQAVIETLLFFNPFIMLLSKAAKLEREHCCDDWVLNYQYSKHDYASALLEIEKQRQQQLAFAMAATNGKKDLLKRIKRLFSTEPQTDFRFSQKLKLAGLGMTVLAVLFTVLPQLNNEDKTRIAVAAQAEIPVAARFASAVDNNVQENYTSKTIVNNKPLAKKVKLIVKRPEAVKAQKDAVTEYSLALINEELFKKNQELAVIATQAAEKAVETEKLLVKVESEESGRKQKSTYYFELNNNGGTPEVKPLVILNKFSKSKAEMAASKAKKNAAVKKQLQQRKRITS